MVKALSLSRLPPTCLVRLRLATEPALAVLGTYARFIVSALTRHMKDALASVDADVPFDRAARTRKHGFQAVAAG